MESSVSTEVIDSMYFDIDDLLICSWNYFYCGFSTEKYYNNSYVEAIIIIGKIYGNTEKHQSDYHKGVAFISKELKVSKAQIKALRKKFSKLGGYAFKTPYIVGTIIFKMTELLNCNENNPIVKEYLKKQASSMYREILLTEQYEAIKEAARNGKRTKVEKAYSDLYNNVTMVGD